jgi:hypothetical protein
MKKIISIFLLSVFCFLRGMCQNDSTMQNKWEFSSDVNFYFLQDDFILLPVIQADKNKLHLEARFNYEDKETFSIWAGYNISGGNNFKYTITPMVGLVTGLTKGIAPGLEMTLEYKKFELYTESEYLFDKDLKENNFYYNWSDLAYYPKENFWIGLSGQRTRLYQTDLDIQRGFFAGTTLKRIDLTGYLYNLFTEDAFGLVTLSLNF